MDIRELAKAALDGKVIQHLQEGNRWIEVTGNLGEILTFISKCSKPMRVRPEYRPYQYDDDNVLGRIVVSKEEKAKGFIIAIWSERNSTWVAVGLASITTEDLFKNYHLEDGQPAGVAL